MRVLVLGGTGYVGQNVIPRLLNQGCDVRCLLRAQPQVQVDGIEWVRGDATDLSAVESAVAGCDVILYLIHSMHSKTSSFEKLDKLIAENVARAARHAQVKHIVYLGGLGKKQIAQTPHLRSRHEVAEILRTSNSVVTELRAAVIIGAGSASFEMIRSLVSHLPIMICPRWVKTKTQPIAIDDVVEYLARSVALNSGYNQTIDIGGPDVLSYKSMMTTVAEQMRLRRAIITVPILTPWLSSHWVGLVTEVAAPLARAIIESVRSETVCENDLALKLFDFTPIGFRESVAKALVNHSVQNR
jgi:uncharacterized protein YbjT (DUF2867 family)